MEAHNNSQEFTGNYDVSSLYSNDARYERYCSVVEGHDQMTMPFERFCKELKRVDKNVLGNTCKSTSLRLKLDRDYSVFDWLSLDNQSKNAHSAFQCDSCHTAHGANGQDPNPDVQNRDVQYRDDAEHQADLEHQPHLERQPDEAILAEMREYLHYMTTVRNYQSPVAITKVFLRLIDDSGFLDLFDTSIVEYLPDVIKSKITSIKKQTEQNCIQALKTTAREDAHQNLMCNISFSTSDKIRQASFITPERGERPKKRSPIGNLSLYSIDRDIFVANIERALEGDITWTHLGELCSVTTKKSGNLVGPEKRGQIIKTYALSQGYEPVFRENLRSVKRKFPLGGSIPVKSSAKKLCFELKSMADDGTVNPGRPTVVHETQKFIIGADGKLAIKTIHHTARHKPLEDIFFEIIDRCIDLDYLAVIRNEDLASMTIDDLTNYLASNGESSMGDENELREKVRIINRSFNGKVWMDDGGIGGHGNYVVTFGLVHDKVNFRPDCQDHVGELDQLHILGRSGSSVADTLRFSEERRLDYQRVRSVFVPRLNMNLYLTVRFGTGDTKIRCVENGMNSSGNYVCPCRIPACSFRRLDVCMTADVCSLSELHDISSAGVMHLTDTPVTSALAKKQMWRECVSLKLMRPSPYVKIPVKKQIWCRIVKHNKGVQRVPGLLHRVSQSALADWGLEEYEVPPMEFMHDSSNVIMHCLEELSSYDSSFGTLLQIYRGDTGKMRAADARHALGSAAKLAEQLFREGKLKREFWQMLQALVEIVQIGYSREESRTDNKIFRFHNLTMLFGLLAVELFGKTPNNLSSRSMYGIYFHNLCSHSAQVYRMINLVSLSAEAGERAIGAIKRTTAKTSSLRADHVQKNAMIRYNYQQVHKEIAVVKEHTSYVAKHLVNVPLLGNTLFPRRWLEPDAWQMRFIQAHLLYSIPDAVQYQGSWTLDEDGLTMNDDPESGFQFPEVRYLGFEKIMFVSAPENKKLNFSKYFLSA